MGRNKRVSCLKCFKVMRSDHLKTHMEQHEDGKFENESSCALSLRTSKTSLDNVWLENVWLVNIWLENVLKPN